MRKEKFSVSHTTLLICSLDYGWGIENSLDLKCQERRVCTFFREAKRRVRGREGLSFTQEGKIACKDQCRRGNQGHGRDWKVI